MKKILLVFGLVILICFFCWIIFFNKSNENITTLETNISFESANNFISYEAWAKEQTQKNYIINKVALPEPEVSLFFVGDIMLSRTVGQKMVEYNDYKYPFLLLQNEISSADLAFANLESPILAGPLVPTGSFTFRADEAVAPALAWAGFDILSLANNHILNKGQSGLARTRELLVENKIDYVGVVDNISKYNDNLVIKEINGLKIAWLAYSYGPSEYSATKSLAGFVPMDQTILQQNLELAKKEADFIIVSMHAGIEYDHSSSQFQKDFAHFAIDHGADLIIGHHPHVVQEVEKYKDKYIFYSLGNFVFDQMWSLATRQGMAVKIIINKDGVEQVEPYPIMIEDYSQPRLAEDDEIDLINNYLKLNFD